MMSNYLKFGDRQNYAEKLRRKILMSLHQLQWKVRERTARYGRTIPRTCTAGRCAWTPMGPCCRRKENTINQRNRDFIGLTKLISRQRTPDQTTSKGRHALAKNSLPDIKKRQSLPPAAAPEASPCTAQAAVAHRQVAAASPPHFHMNLPPAHQVRTLLVRLPRASQSQHK